VKVPAKQSRESYSELLRVKFARNILALYLKRHFDIVLFDFRSRSKTVMRAEQPLFALPG
jgi:hypothetical protein